MQTQIQDETFYRDLNAFPVKKIQKWDQRLLWN